MSEEKSLIAHINPENRSVSISDPHYQRAWTEAFERIRAEYEEELTAQVDKGEIKIPPGIPDSFATTPEAAIHFMAHTGAQLAMQRWAVERGIGMVGVSSGSDHGQTIEYIDDPNVPFLDCRIEGAPLGADEWAELEASIRKARDAIEGQSTQVPNS